MNLGHVKLDSVSHMLSCWTPIAFQEPARCWQQIGRTGLWQPSAPSTHHMVSGTSEAVSVSPHGPGNAGEVSCLSASWSQGRGQLATLSSAFGPRVSLVISNTEPPRGVSQPCRRCRSCSCFVLSCFLVHASVLRGGGRGHGPGGCSLPLAFESNGMNTR